MTELIPSVRFGGWIALPTAITHPSDALAFQPSGDRASDNQLMTS
ncbi:hypothetical protein [Pajaroellobacter abortibovis]|nr:hypothetical protein [Pajaroellobacter abortibovis]